MFSKVFTSSALVLALVLQAHAHAAVAPALGVSGTPVRGDVKRPSNAEPCGAGVDIASAIDSSTVVTAAADGAIDATAIDFNGGADGSRKFTAKVDPTGTGKSFVAMTVTTNGIEDPTSVGSQPLVASLPAGTKCTGGASKDKCLVQFVSTAGFGNCVAVTQGAAAGAARVVVATNDVSTPVAGAAAKAKKGKKGDKKGGKKDKKGKKEKKAKRAGTTAARAVLHDLEDRGEEAVEVVKRGVSWVWA